MENLPLLIYWIGVLESLNNINSIVIVLLLICLCILGFISLMAYVDDEETALNTCKKLAKYASITLAVSACIGLVVPSSKTVWMIVGAKTVIELQKNPDFQTTASNLLTLLNSKMTEPVKSE